jgi:TrmH family RNA methyltransferase
VALTEGTVELFNPKVTRATMSSLFAVKCAALPLEDAVGVLKGKGYKIYCGAVGAPGKSLFETQLRGRCAFIIGNEGGGASGAAMGMADALLRIPMPGGAESLNAGTAAAVMLYEHLRQNQ